jgi:Na+-translocating ferredoxin:NAD+ oxidoreductase RnfC subunit
MEMTDAKKAIIGIKEKYSNVIEMLKNQLPEKVSLHLLGDFYPAGDEFILVYLLTGRIIPPGALPLNVGCVVNNVETLINVGRSSPVITKYLTVAGAVNDPVTLSVPVGISFHECIKLAGGTNVPNPVALVGGAMMGTFCDDLSSPVTKTTGGLIILPRDHSLIRLYTRSSRQKQRIGRSACDQCSYCTELCPRYLLGHPIQPHVVMRSLGFTNPSPARVIGSLFCCECNLCTLWSCPEDLDPRAACIDSKKIVTDAGMKWREQEVKIHPLADDRRTPLKRLMNRLNLNSYVNKGPLLEKVVDTQRIVLPLKQHLGVPSQPIVHVGDMVKVGQEVATVPNGSLGASIHASIEGRVVSIDGSIVIERR